MTETSEKTPYWSLTVDEVISARRSSNKGLTSEEAKKRRATYGKNTITEKNEVGKLGLLLRQFKNPLIIVLLIGGLITLALGEAKDAIFIIVAALVNASLGYYQENKAEEALNALKTYVTNTVRVFRDGSEQKINAEDLVPGDVIYLSQGDKIAADARLIFENDLEIDEALLTGESRPAKKDCAPVDAESSLADRTSMVWSGSLAVNGFGKAIVTETGDNTEIGKIATLVAAGENEATPLQKALTKISLQASGILLILTIGVFLIASSVGMETLDAFLISLAILVSAIPEGLPIVMTVILAIGVERLAKKNGVVRKLAAAETLGSTSVILTDKTGTLTEARMSLEAINPYANASEEVMLRLSLLNMTAAVENPHDPVAAWRTIGSPVESALIKGAGERGIQDEGTATLVNMLPFNSKNKFSASTHTVQRMLLNEDSEDYVSILSMLGAPEMILEHANVSETEKEAIQANIDQMAKAGDRLVAIGYKVVKSPEEISLSELNPKTTKLHFLGTFSLRDPIRKDVPEAITRMQRAGVRIMIATGDHAGTATAVARDIGITVSDDEVVNGRVLEKMTQEEIIAKLPQIKLIARVSPQGKQKIVDALQATGEVVAMNGDGINDAPALKKANIGIAMGSGTDVSKGVADLVLLDDNFITITEAITEGRRIIANIRKAIAYLTSALLNEVLLIGGALALALPLPLNPLQILWVNFFTDSFPGIALAFEDKIDPIGKKPTDIHKGLFTRRMKVIVLINGFISTILLFGMYVYLLRIFDEATVRTFTFMAFGTYTLFLGFSMRSLTKGITEYNPFGNPYLVVSAGLGFLFMLATLYIPFLQRLLDTTPLSLPWIIAIILFGLVNIILIEITKFIYRPKHLTQA